MKTPLSGLSLTLLSSALFLMAPAAQASIVGDTLTCATSPSFIFSCSAISAVDGPGVEFTLSTTSHSLTADFGAAGLILTDPEASNMSFSSSFGPGITLSFTDTTNAFTSATFISASAPNSGTGFSASNVSFSGGTLTLSISGVTFSGGGTVNIGLTTAPASAPEPGTIALTASSMLVAGFWMRSRKKA